uniref:Cullin family profile domain-containing protein n=1 Tax=Globodera rostochiensis TaxID=31243 RepID=A0A914I2D5_GLORO
MCTKTHSWWWRRDDFIAKPYKHWEVLKKAIEELLLKCTSSHPYEELYRIAYTMVLFNHGDALYEGLKELINQHLQTRIREAVVESIKARCFFEILNRVWTDYSKSMIMIKDILLYFDRRITKPNIETVRQLGMRIFREQIVEYPVINEQLKATFIGMLSLHRQKNISEWIDMKNVCQMLIELSTFGRDYYEHQFEGLCLRKTASFCRHANQILRAENGACIYEQKVIKVLAENVQRIECCLDQITAEKMIKMLYEEVISRNMSPIVELEDSSMVFMLRNDRIGDLHCLYDLLRRVPNGHKTMENTMSRFLHTKGIAAIASDHTKHQQQPGEVSEAVGDVLNPITFIQNLIKLKEHLDRFLTEAFDNDREFMHRIQSDLEHFLNLSPKAAEYLSLYIDDTLKKGTRMLDENEIEVVLSRALALFRLLREKDMFEKYYKQHLAKRLLLQKNVSVDAEKSVISKLKPECGTHFTSKIERMFLDIELSNTIMNDYSNPTELDLSVRVLTSSIWTTNQTPMCTLPRSAEQAFRQFEQLGMADVAAFFYPTGPTKTNCIVAADQQETGDAMRSSFSSKSAPAMSWREEQQKLLTVTTYMMCLLVRFNHRAKMTYEQLLKETQVPDRELKRCLQALSMSKQSQRILCRHGTAKDIESADEFCVNDQFSSKLMRVKIQMVSDRGETESERSDTRAKVDNDRKLAIEAAIVRVMKTRKKLLHDDLVAEVANQLKTRFLPDPSCIKKCLESLTEREYLERDKSNLKMKVAGFVMSS